MAEPPAARFVTQDEDSLRWRNVVRRPSDVIISAPPGLDDCVDVVVARVLGEPPVSDIAGANVPVWVDDVAVPLAALVEELDAFPGTRVLLTRGPADAIPFDRRCRYVVLCAAPVPVTSQSAWFRATSPESHLRSWWDLRQEPNVTLVHRSDLEGDLPTPPERHIATDDSRWSDPVLRWLHGGDRALGCPPAEFGSVAVASPATGGFHPVYGRIDRAQAANTMDAITDRRVAEARRAGLFDDLALHGKPIPDIDRRRKPGWWANQFVAKERHTARGLELDEMLRSAMPALWRLDSEASVLRRVGELNASVAEFNRVATTVPRPELDPESVLATWRRLRRRSG